MNSGEKLIGEVATSPFFVDRQRPGYAHAYLVLRLAGPLLAAAQK